MQIKCDIKIKFNSYYTRVDPLIMPIYLKI